MPFGFRPVRRKGGAPVSGALDHYPIESGGSVDLFQGDLVKLSGGYLVPAESGDTDIIGVFMGAEYVDPNSGQPVYRNNIASGQTSEDGVITGAIVSDPDATFLVEADSSVTIAATDIGGTATFAVGTGNTVTGLSGANLDAVTDTDPDVRILGAYEVEDNELGTAGATVEVVLLNHVTA